MPLFISAQTWRDFVTVKTSENKIQQNDDVIRIAALEVQGMPVKSSQN